ncbi:MAG: NDP-sugar synthase [Bdellovibrionales bacterium]|nr:NDP-sugar synthase [Bdellovibrionales bacterium]
MHALILAAGKGTRFRPYTEKQAKPALPFLNVPLLGFPLAHLEKSGLTHLIVNTHHLPDTVKSVVERLTVDRDYDVTFSDEQPDILGSGGALVHAKEALLRDNQQGLFVYANGDEVMLFPHLQSLKPLLKAHLEFGGLATMLVCAHSEVGSRFNGVWVTPENHILGFSKIPLSENSKGLHFTGIMVLSEKIFQYLPPSGESHILKDGLLPAIAHGEKVCAFTQEDLLWFETGDPTSYLQATQSCVNHLFNPSDSHHSDLLRILKRYYPNANLSQDFFLGKASDGQSVLNGSFLVAGDRVQIAPGVRLRGFNVIGDDCHIGQGMELENCVIGPHLPPLINSTLRNQILFS